ncbi:hypothetical protein [Paludisphaera rhizosphaerae]|uniref:hypothetical protein n=1 Tax=Paludisphaera rhizosphaerae TaxID=2711216 RepID=UPI0013EA76BE|nr:hypothetical protein [Paludisphaera rhizosphaerae]
MGSVIESWRTPKTSRDLGRAVELFIRDGLGIMPDELERSRWGIEAMVDLEDGPGAMVIVQDREATGMKWVYLDEDQQALLDAWEAAGEPPVEQVNFRLDLGGPLSPEAEAAARAVMAGKVCEEIGWTPDEVAAMRKRNFPDILERVDSKRHTGRTGPPTNSAELAEAVKACLKAAYGLVATGDDYCLEVDIAPYGVLRMVVGKPEDFEAKPVQQAEAASTDEVQAKTPMGRLLAAALEIYHDPGTIGDRQGCIDKILNTIVRLAHGYAADAVPAESRAVRFGGTTVLVEPEDFDGDVERVHVIDDADTSNLGDEDEAEDADRFVPAHN